MGLWSKPEQGSQSGTCVRIRMTRDSLSMGDDCMAPNAREMLVDASSTLLDLLNLTASHVPPMRNFEWEVKCDTKLLGRLTSGSDAKYQVTLELENTEITTLPEYEIFCRKVLAKEPLPSHDEQPQVMNFCPKCGRKNTRDKFCRDCGSSLLKS